MSQCCIVTCEYVITFLDVTTYKKNYETVTSFDIATCPSNTMHFVKHVAAVLSQTLECFHCFSFFSSNTEYEHEEFHSSPVKAVLCHPIWFQDALTSTDSILWMRPNLMFNNKRQKTIDVNTRTFCILFLVIFGQLLTSFYDHWISYSQSYYQVLWDHKCDL